MKKILILIDSLKLGGGAERVVSSIATKLSSSYKILILTFNDFENRYYFKGTYYSFKENIGQWRNLLKILRYYEIIRPFRIFKILRGFSPDIILSFTDYVNLYTIFTKALFNVKVPLIISVHSNPIQKYLEKDRHIRFLMKIFYRFKLISKIVTVSKEIEIIFQKFYSINKKKLKTIYNGVNLNKINEMKEKEVKKHREIFNNEDFFKFITVGRLVSLKRHKKIIEAFSKVKNEAKHSKLIILGDGPLRKELEYFVKIKSLKDDVLFLGLKKNPFKYIRNSNAFILFSKYEALPTVLIEALACGVPIISSNCRTGPKEILGDNSYGILVKVNDLEDLIKNMILLTKNKELTLKYSKLSLERANFFNIENIIQQWISLFYELNSA